MHKVVLEVFPKALEYWRRLNKILLLLLGGARVAAPITPSYLHGRQVSSSIAVDYESRVRRTLAEDDQARRLLAAASSAMQHLLHHPVVL